MLGLMSYDGNDKKWRKGRERKGEEAGRKEKKRRERRRRRIGG